ncbi:hypothetical protein [Actinomadura sp. GTD37]|uniref:hypothetical protein n=1 Tax=Actinomadura sp. GTD37 TaxID=1778030 RepID=UPI0035BF2A33
MAHDVRDLTEVMTRRSEAGSPPPDLLPRLRRRVRRDRRRRAVLGAAGTALAVTAAFAAVQQFGWSPADTAPPVMAGSVDDAFPKSPPQEGMRPLREVRFSMVGRKARVQFTPTGPYSMITYRCSVPFTAYSVRTGVLNAVGCDANGGGTGYLRTEPGVPYSFDVAALPPAASPGPAPGRPPSVAELDRYLASHEPFPGTWSVRIYAGACDSETCAGPPAPPRQPPVDGLERLARTTHTADGRPRTVAFSPSGAGVRLRLTCRDGAAVAVLTDGAGTKVVNCEIAESRGVVWDRTARPDARQELRITVLPAEASPVGKTDAAALAANMKGVEPAGKWTLEVYDR